MLNQRHLLHSYLYIFFLKYPREFRVRILGLFVKKLEAENLVLLSF